MAGRNMEITVAKTAGFCFGVKRAVEKVYDQIATGKKQIYTYGPIIHNEEVVRDLEEKGVQVINSKEELEALKEGVVVIRSHGVGREIYELLERQGLELVDATCPFVKKIHKIVREQCEAGRRVIIVGNEHHPEVEGIKGWGNEYTLAVESLEEFENLALRPDEKLSIVAQTTFNYNKFQELVEIFLKKGYDISVVNTICNATEERQTEAKDIAAKVDAMIVIGGKHSSNTRKLYEICCKECAHTCLIQTLDDLHLELPKAVRLVGITAGASTPNKLIEEVQNYVRINF